MACAVHVPLWSILTNVNPPRASAWSRSATEVAGTPTPATSIGVVDQSRQRCGAAPWAVRGGPAGDGESLFVCERARVLVGGVGLLHADAPIAIANANATIAIDPRGRITSPSRCR